MTILQPDHEGGTGEGMTTHPLERFLKDANLSQRALAKKAGVTLNSIWRLCSGAQRTMDAVTAQKIVVAAARLPIPAGAHRITLEDLVFPHRRSA